MRSLKIKPLFIVLFSFLIANTLLYFSIVILSNTEYAWAQSASTILQPENLRILSPGETTKSIDRYQAELNLTSLVFNDDFDGWWWRKTGNFTIIVYQKKGGLYRQVFDTVRSFGEGTQSIDSSEGSFFIASTDRYVDIQLHLRQKDKVWDNEGDAIRTITLDMSVELNGGLVKLSGNNIVNYLLKPIDLSANLSS